MSFQGLTPDWGVSPSLLDVTGKELLGTPLNAPLTSHKVEWFSWLMVMQKILTKYVGRVCASHADDQHEERDRCCYKCS